MNAKYHINMEKMFLKAENNETSRRMLYNNYFLEIILKKNPATFFKLPFEFLKLIYLPVLLSDASD